MTLFTAAGREHVDAQAHEVFDVSGAGDTVLATLAAMRAIGLPWADAMACANRAGGTGVGKPGTSVVTAAEHAGDPTGSTSRAPPAASGGTRWAAGTAAASRTSSRLTT